ncbi:hypothetical protein FGG08_005853 [Glutinoglossum americanum]|uniref:Uncharacterized protein n=1 Tax=Glutinoglossum americanum TaxID=1670608 RepID=A0A9P8HXD0_9PEZI|nr:hypothetical protein FGG08_005853 [Glutinoglossum americanum]
MAATVPEPPYFSSPKRKRDITEAPTVPTRLNTNPAPPAPFAEEARQGGGSPRTAVAKDLELLKLQGKGRGKIDFHLVIRNGREAGESEAMDNTLEVEGKPRKRAKKRSAVAETERDSMSITLRPKNSEASVRHDAMGNSSISLSSDPGSNDTQKRTLGARFDKSSITSTVNLMTKTRLKSPPLSSKSAGEARLEILDVKDVGNDEDERDLRSSLTWRDDEITGMDINDPDDDGEGVNGIGYKPTPAQAYARIEKRKQQILDYRSREANEARKRRIERRGRLTTPVTEDGEMATRKVRFAVSGDG